MDETINFFSSCFLQYSLAILMGYSLGSIPFGLLLSKFFLNQDVRKQGSGNIGATNVLRLGNKKIAACTLILDALKGTLAVFLVTAFWPQTYLWAGIAAILGHAFPVWLKFKGGKAVATTLGVLLALHWPLALVVICTWIIGFLIFRISSLAALVASFSLPLWTWVLEKEDWIWMIFSLTALLFFLHRDNIKRLINGQEKKTS